MLQPGLSYSIRVTWPDGTEKIFPSQSQAAMELKMPPRILGKYATRSNNTILLGPRKGIKIERISE